jgi:hypothetical protein
VNVVDLHEMVNVDISLVEQTVAELIVEDASLRMVGAYLVQG